MAAVPKDYKCTKCGAQSTRELLTVKKVLFLEMGVGARTLRSRVIGWLCPPCVAADEQYNAESYEHQKGQGLAARKAG